MNAMVLGLAVNGSDNTPQERWALELSILCVSGAVVVMLAPEFLAALWENLKRRRFGVEGLFLVGILACLAVSSLSLSTGAGGTFADVAAMLLVIYSLGRQIGSYGKSKILKSLGDWSPDRRQARRVGERIPIAASQVRSGDRLLVLPGEAVPVDGRIVAGAACFQEASLTGEAFALAKGVGEELKAGVYPVDASVEMVATRDGAESTLDEIRRLVLAGLAVPGREQGLALAVLRYFTPAVLLTAAATFWWQSARQPLPEAIFHSLSVMVIACPCALGFATPLAVWTAIARLREIGIVARTGDAVERLAEIDTVVFDKTGTLTLPEEYDVTLELTPDWRHREGEVLSLLRAAEEVSQHPLARALEVLWRERALPEAPALIAYRLVPGQGIEARFADGRTLFAGGAGERDLEVRIDHHLAARIERRELIHPTAPPALAALEKAGLRVLLATGDCEERAAALPIAERFARQTPFDKHALLADLTKRGNRVLFAGDGLNDLAAMAWSHVSLTVGQSPAMVREMSGLVLRGGDWRALGEGIAIAREARKLVRANLAFSLAYNVLGMGMAAAGILHPVAAALIMLFSSLTVILYSMKLMDQECVLI
jgi:Cu2+-exporting ATPase/Cu+-exporting ATPase